MGWVLNPLRVFILFTNGLNNMKIPFNRPYITGKESDYIGEFYQSGHFSGDGMFTKRCNEWLIPNSRHNWLMFRSGWMACSINAFR